MKIGHRALGPGAPVLIVAELSCNHLQRLDLAKKTLRAMKAAGADAVKFQTYTADTLTIDCDRPEFRIAHGTVWDSRTYYDLYEEAHTPWEWHEELIRVAEDEGLLWFSSAFDPTAVDFLESLGTPAHKIASFEITDVELIRKCAETGKPVIISTGIARLSDIELAVENCRLAGNEQIALLKCTSAYPARVEDANLRTIPHLATTFGVVPGLSDHTPGHAVAVAAVALGARLIEKHFIIERSLGGPDASFSMEPEEFRQMVDAVRQAEAALGGVSYEPTPQARRNRAFARSLFVVKDVAEGELFTRENVRSIRPGHGLAPVHLPEVLGKRAARQLARGTPLRWSDVVE